MSPPVRPQQPQQPPQPQQAPASPDLGSFGSLPDAAPQKGAPAVAAAAPTGPDLGSFANLPAAQAPKPMSTSAAWSDQIGDIATMGITPKLSGAISGAEAAGKYMLAGLRNPAVADTQSWGGLGSSIGDAYSAERDRINAQLANARAQHPLPLVGKIGAAFLNPIGEVLPGPAKTAIGTVGRMALGGAAGGGIQAAAQTQGDLGDYAKNIGIGMGAGALVGGGLGAGNQVVGRLFGPSAAQTAAQYAAAKAAPDLTGPVVDQLTTNVASKPLWQTAWKLAERTALEEGQPIPSLARIQQGTPVTSLPVRAFQYISDAMKDAIDQGFKNGGIASKEAAAAKNNLADLMSQVKAQVPALGQANAMYAARMSGQDVLDAITGSSNMRAAGVNAIKAALSQRSVNPQLLSPAAIRYALEMANQAVPGAGADAASVVTPRDQGP